LLSVETTVAEWRDGYDLLGWQEIGHAYNKYWGISCSDDEWRAVLEPPSRRRITDVCQLIATRAVRPLIRPALVLGSPCASAGAFLIIRSLLHDAGAQAEEIAPSTPLAPYTRRFTETFLGPISRLAPGSLPQIRIRTPFLDIVGWVVVVAVLLVAVGMSIGWRPFTVFGVVLFVFCCTFIWYAWWHMLPGSVSFGEMKTFRDLAVAVAEKGTVERILSPLCQENIE
jgi:hypothetical protein